MFLRLALLCILTQHILPSHGQQPPTPTPTQPPPCPTFSNFTESFPTSQTVSITPSGASVGYSISTTTELSEISILGDLTNLFESIVVITDLSAPILQPSSLSLSGQSSIIGENGILALNSATFNGNGSLSLEEGTILTIESNGKLSWERGTIIGKNNSRIEFLPDSSFELTASENITQIQRSMNGVSLIVQSRLQFKDNGFDYLTCTPFTPEEDSEAEIVRLEIKNSEITLQANGTIETNFSTSPTSSIIAVMNSKIFLEDNSEIRSVGDTWIIDNNSLIEINSGAATLSNMIVRQSAINIRNTSSLAIRGNGTMDFSDSQMNILDSSELIINDGATVEIEKARFRSDGNSALRIDNNATLRLDTSGDLYLLRNTSHISVQGSTFEIIGSLSLVDEAFLNIDHSNFVVNGVRKCSVPETFTCFCSCNSTASFTNVCGSGIDNTTCLDSCYSDGLSCTASGTCDDWQCFGFCEKTCETGFTVDEAILRFAGESRSTIVGLSLFDLTFGEIYLNNTHRFQLFDSELKIREGSFIAAGSSTLDFVNGELEVSGGGISFSESSSLRAVNGSELEVISGSIVLDADSRVLMVASEIELAGGELVFAGNSKFTCSSLPSNDFNLEGIDGEESSGAMTVEITSGKLFFMEESIAEFANGTFVNVHGTFEMIGASKFVGFNSTIEVSSTIICPSPQTLCSCSCESNLSSEILCAPEINAELCESFCFDTITGFLNEDGCSDNCTETCPEGAIQLDGAVLLGGTSSAAMLLTNLTVNEGSLTTSGGHQFVAQEAIVQLLSGFWLSENVSIVSFIESSLTIASGGEFNITDSATLIQSASEIEVFGHVLLAGKEVTAMDSFIFVRNGTLTFGEKSESVFDNTEVLLDGTGNIYAFEESSTNFFNSSVQITAGAMLLSDFGELTLQGTSLLNISSSLICSDSSLLFVENSVVDVGGNFTMSDDSSSDISSSIISIGSTTSSNSGNILLYDRTSLSIRNSSVTTLTGNLELSGSTRMSVSNNSSVTIEGDGFLSVSENGLLEITGNSFVSVATGTVVIQDNANIEITDNSLLITDDLLDLRGDTMVSLPEGNQFIVDTNGYVAVAQQLNVSTTSSSSSVLPNIDNSGIFDLSQSTGGNIFVPVDNSASGMVSFGSSRFNLAGVRNSGQVFYGRSQVDMVDSSTTQDSGQIREPVQMQQGSTSQGVLNLRGDFVNEGDIVHDESTGSLYEIAGSFRGSKDSTIYITILDPREPGPGYTLLDIQNAAELDGDIEICIPSTAKLGNTKSLDVLKFGNLGSKFRNIKFRCSKQHNTPSFEKQLVAKRAGKAVEYVQHKMLEAASSCTSSEYTSGSFAVLFDGCGGGSESEKLLYVWLSVGFVGGALIIIIIAIFLYEFRFVRKLLAGKEGGRIQHVRYAQSKSKSGSRSGGSGSVASIAEMSEDDSAVV